MSALEMLLPYPTGQQKVLNDVPITNRLSPSISPAILLADSTILLPLHVPNSLVMQLASPLEILSPDGLAGLEVPMDRDDVDAFSDFTDMTFPPTTLVYIPNAPPVVCKVNLLEGQYTRLGCFSTPRLMPF